MVENEDPFVRADWVRELVCKNYGDEWGAIVNVCLPDWASKQTLKKCYVYQLKDIQVLLWCKESTGSKP